MNFLKSIYDYITGKIFFNILFYVSCFYFIIKLSDGILMVSIVLGVFFAILSDIEGYVREIKNHFVPENSDDIIEVKSKNLYSNFFNHKQVEDTVEQEFKEYSVDETHLRNMISLLRQRRTIGSHNKEIIDWYLKDNGIKLDYLNSSFVTNFLTVEEYFLHSYNEWYKEFETSENGTIYTKAKFDEELGNFINRLMNVIGFSPLIEEHVKGPIEEYVENIDWYLSAVNRLLMLKISASKELELSNYLKLNELTLQFTDHGLSGSDKQTPVIEEFINLYIKWEDSIFGNTTSTTESYIYEQKIKFTNLLKDLFIIK